MSNSSSTLQTPLTIAAYLTLIVIPALLNGCPHYRTGLPPTLRMPTLEQQSTPSGEYHTVAKGETLSEIARRYGADYQYLAEVNNLKPPYSIRPNDEIFIPRKENDVSSDDTKDASFFAHVFGQGENHRLLWPVIGKVSSEFGVRNGVQFNGIEISAPAGSAVKAAADGRVGHIGKIRSYGKVVIIQHPKRIVTVYGNMRDIQIEQGTKVSRGDTLGTVDKGRIGKDGLLHFEVRHRARPRNPLFYLGRRPEEAGKTRSD